MVDPPDGAYRSAGKKQLLGQRRLAGINVGKDTDISSFRM